MEEVDFNSQYVHTELRERLRQVTFDHASDLVVAPIEIVLQSDKLIQILNRLPDKRGRLPILSAIHGFGFVKPVEGLTKTDMHNYAYNDERFKEHITYVQSQTDNAEVLERHFFTHGLEIGILARRARLAEIGSKKNR